MRDIDAMIDEALDQEERDLLRSIGEEPGFFGQVFGIFAGPAGWVSVLLMAVQGAAFLAGAWASWRFFEAQDALTALHWGLPGGVLLLMSLIIKMAMWPQMHLNRVMRELKRIELEMVRKRA
jgi:hypothetical protein